MHLQKIGYCALFSCTLLSFSTLLSMEIATKVVSEPIVTISEDEFKTSSDTLNEKLLKAAQHGFFYLEIPDNLKESVKDAVQFAHTFYCDQELKEKTKEIPGITGFHELGQSESLMSMEEHWQSIYPQPILQLANRLTMVSETVLGKVLSLVVPHLPQELWRQATGGAYGKSTSHSFSFNHFRTDKEIVGYPAHRDIGFITLLFINKDGLYAHINGKWQPVQPKEGYFVVNFGSALEILVNDHSKLVAAWHVVEQITQEKHVGDRISFGLFSNCDEHAPVMQATSDGELIEVYPTYLAFTHEQINKAKNTPDLPAGFGVADAKDIKM